VSSTYLMERSRKQNLKIEKLGTYRNIFASLEAEIQQQLQVVAQDVSPKDQYKIKERIEICKEEEVLVNGLDFKRKEKKEIEKNKEVLIITECSVPDYGTEEIKNKIMQAKSVGLAKQDDLIKRIIANIKQIEVYSKMEVDININNKTEIVNKTSNEFDKVKDISSSIWTPVSKSSQ
ncbi:17240_t:CDS:2, partial [Gigaspora margarita]